LLARRGYERPRTCTIVRVDVMGIHFRFLQGTAFSARQWLAIVRQAVCCAVAAGALLACTARPERCWVCEREIHSHMRAVLSLEGGREAAACCPRCALHYKQEQGAAVRDITVSDYAGGGLMPLTSAFLVEGSDETPCIHHPPLADENRAPLQVCYDRCMPSLIAFKELASAEAFMAEHGGALHRAGAVPTLQTEPR